MNLQINQINKYSNVQIMAPAYRPLHYNRKTLPKDQCSFGSSNFELIYEDNSRYLKSIKFSKPLEVSDAFLKIASSDNQLLIYNMFRKSHTLQQIENLGNFLATKPIGKVKVTSLTGYGAFAFAFETADGKILKITDINHFPDGRKPAKFDLPIIESGRLNKYPPYHYYIEEKVTQDNLSQSELKQLIKEIKAMGYRMKDYLVHYDETFETDIKTEQFGRAKDGKIYLIDPGCAIETDMVYNSNKKYNFKNLFKRLIK